MPMISKTNLVTRKVTAKVEAPTAMPLASDGSHEQEWFGGMGRAVEATSSFRKEASKKGKEAKGQFLLAQSFALCIIVEGGFVALGKGKQRNHRGKADFDKLAAESGVKEATAKRLWDLGQAIVKYNGKDAKLRNVNLAVSQGPLGVRKAFEACGHKSWEQARRDFIPHTETFEEMVRRIAKTSGLVDKADDIVAKAIEALPEVIATIRAEKEAEASQPVKKAA